MARVVREDRAAQEALAAEPSIAGKRGKVIAKIHGIGESAEVSYVYAVEKQHRFPNGTIGEGWLIEPENLVGHGDPIWVVTPKGRVEWIVAPQHADETGRAPISRTYVDPDESAAGGIGVEKMTLGAQTAQKSNMLQKNRFGVQTFEIWPFIVAWLVDWSRGDHCC
jgi:hypothetical protein